MIKDSDRKILWTRAGNRCSICGQALTLNTENGKNFVLGEEAHIVSRQVNGPRYKVMDKYDSYDNLILLCPNHHSIVDKNVVSYSVERLKEIKRQHEQAIEKITDPRELHNEGTVYRNKEFPLHVISTGSEFVNIVDGAYSLSISNDDPNGEKESELIDSLHEELEALDILQMLPLSERPKIQLRISNLINELFQNGFYVIGARENAKIKNKGSLESWSIAHIGIVRIKGSKIAKVVEPKKE